MPTIYHILSESEPFSEHDGGAVSRWVANVTRGDEDAIVVAPRSDDSWGVDRSLIRNLPRLIAHKRLLDRGGHYLPWLVRLRLLRGILKPALENLGRGDTVWVHGRPEFAAAIEPYIHARGARLFLHLHNSHLVQWSTRVTRHIHADCYVFVSRYLRDEALEKFPALGRAEVLVNGADPELFFPSAEPVRVGGTPSVLFASRLVPDKGLHILLDAMRVLQKRGVRVRGVVIGGAGFGQSLPTPYVLEMRSMAPSNVRFEPYCAGTDLARMFREADIFCLPACWNDPFPLTVLEAMASGVPVVASRSGGIPDQLAYGGGILVERNSVPELADALEYLAGNEKRRIELGKEAHASFHAHFTWKQTRTTYRAILGGRSDALPVGRVETRRGDAA